MIKDIQDKTTVLILTITLIAILLSIKFTKTAFYGLLLGNMFVLLVGLKTGYSLSMLLKMMKKGVDKASIVLIIMALIGMLSAAWMVSGTIPTMMYYGFKYLSKVNLLLASFLLTSIISMILGTALGTVTAVGIPLLEIGKTMGIPSAMIVGAIVSGVYIGDRTSPMSSSVNLTAAVTETKLMDNIRHMLRTLLPVYIICLILYYWIGHPYSAKLNISLKIQEIQNLLFSNFMIQWFMLIPPFFIAILAILKIPMVYCMIVSLIYSILLVFATKNISVYELLSILLKGYYPENQQILKLISGSGLISMKNVILIISSSTALNGMLEDMAMLDNLMKRFLGQIKGKGQLILKTSFLSTMISVLTCNQSLSVIIPGRFLRQEFLDQDISINTLARTIADTGIVTVALIPWNVNAVVITLILGVDTVKYSPYAFLCYLLPLITIFYGYMERGNDSLLRMRKKYKKVQHN